MRSIRWTLLGVAFAVGVPVVVLAWRALDGLAFERTVRHQAVAERAFDEMERALSYFLEREEERPFEAYRFYPGEGGELSPLARPAELPFVVGAFQIDPDGSVHSPHVPRNEAQARALGHWPPTPEATDAALHARAAALRLWHADAAPRAESARDTPPPVAQADPPALVQAPGTTRALRGGDGGRGQADPDAPSDDETTAYDVLREFNTGADRRAERKQKVSRGPAPGGRARGSAPSAPPPRRAEADLAAAAPAPTVSALEAAPRQEARVPSPPREAALREDAPTEIAEGFAMLDAEPEEAPAVVGALASADAPPLRIAVDPMVGRLVDDWLVLSRTVLVGEQGYRQGLVLARGTLQGWLAGQVPAVALGEQSGLEWDTTTDPDPSARYVYEHRFAEPFDALTARLSLAPLPGLGNPGAIYGLVALLFVFGTAGLFAVHRTVAVTVDFAQRRNNFVAAVTHELKTPLTAIRMYAEMLRDGLVRDGNKREEYYGTITDESERLSRLIDNVLEFSRLEQGRRELALRAGPVGPILEEAAAKLRTHAEREGFELQVAVEPDLPPVRYDRDALLQVVFNLVDNAMKYAGGASERVVVIEGRRHDSRVVVSVRDFGPGVAGGHLGRIFDPFYRGEDELTRTTKGTGIGLALVKELAERMGAAVSGVNPEDGGFRVGLAFEAAEGSA